MSSVRLAFTSSEAVAQCFRKELADEAAASLGSFSHSPARRGLAVLTTDSRHDTARGPRRLSALGPGMRGIVARVECDDPGRTDRLLALGVTPGAAIVVLQTFPGIVFLCDQTELAVERAVADAILIRPTE
jgi:Fe2+ transport system protein FeoA